MKRRDFIKTIPAAALLPAAVSVTAENAKAVEETTRVVKAAKGVRPVNPKGGDPAAHDGIHCDQFGVDEDGKPISNKLTGTGSDALPKGKDHKMTLTMEEQDILNGSKGEVMAKVLKTIVMHGELFGAERLAD